MEAFGAAQVLLDGDEEAPVLRELGHVALRGLVELLVAVELREEARRPAGMHERRHLEEELPGVVAPCGRLERLEILEPGVEHRRCNEPALQVVTVAGSGTPRPGASDRVIRERRTDADPPYGVTPSAAMEIGDKVIYRGRVLVLLGHDPMSVPDRRAQVEDPETGARFDVPYDELAPAQGFDPAA
jgi:hypothetical protein